MQGMAAAHHPPLSHQEPSLTIHWLISVGAPIAVFWNNLPVDLIALNIKKDKKCCFFHTLFVNFLCLLEDSSGFLPNTCCL